MTRELDAGSHSSGHFAAPRPGSPVPCVAGRRLTRPFLGVAFGCLAFAASLSQAEPGTATTVTEIAPLESAEVSEPMRVAILLAKAAGGGVGFVGSALALDETAAPAEVAIIQPVTIEKMKTGEILMLVRDDCKLPTGCVMARRIIEKRGSDVATMHYGRPAPDAGKVVDASVVGRVAYVVNLETGLIRDMRKDDTKVISLVEALRREAKKWHYVGNTVRLRPIRV